MYQFKTEIFIHNENNKCKLYKFLLQCDMDLLESALFQTFLFSQIFPGYDLCPYFDMIKVFCLNN